MAFSGALPASFPFPSTDAVARLRRMAGEAERVGRAAEAADLLLGAVALDATQPEPWCELAQALLGARRPEAALNAAERTLALAPDTAAGHRHKAGALARLGRLDAAAAALAEAERREPQAAETLALKALLTMLAGRLEEADRLFAQALSLNPGLAEAQANHAQVLSRLDRHEAALKAAEAARAAKPELAGVHHLLGSFHLRSGRLDEAEAAWRQALRLEPELRAAATDLAELLRRRGREDETESVLRQAIAASPDRFELHLQLSGLLFTAGRVDGAAEAARQALRLKPGCVEARLNLAGALSHLGRGEEAEREARMALNQRPDSAEAHITLGTILQAQGNLQDAETAFLRAVLLRPDLPITHTNFGNILKMRGQVADAVRAHRQALAIRPDYPEGLSNLGIALYALPEHLPEAEKALRRAIALKPDLLEAACNLGLVLQATGRLEEAEALYRRVLEHKPDHLSSLINLGTTLTAQGRIRDAIALYRRGLGIAPPSPLAGSNLLFALNYLPDQDRAAVLAEHRAWDARHGGGRVTPLPPPAAPRDPDRRLRLGLVSGDLGRHPVAQFLLPLLRHLDPAAVEVHAYSNRAVEDATSAALRALTAGWRRTLGVSDRELARQIRADGIDILLDLAGHTNGNRLAVFAHRPAPLQVSWLGYPNTTGLGAIDYRLTDAVADPEGADAFHTERLVRLPRGFLCYQPPAEAPEITPPPARRAGAVTFGSFNNLTKVTPPAVAVWAAILHRVAGARLVVKSHQLSDAGNRGRLRGLFEAHGIDGARLELVDWRPRPVEHLAALARVDIALDSFPYTGTATTCEALWMGVPVVTWAGDRHAGRVSASLLNQAGLGELVARDAAEYVQLAVALAGDRERLERYRQDLRGRLRASPLCDGAGFARQFEQTMRALWRNWCAG
ncbi:tetratricopeptide repeat protein, partial [Azospirillum sp.]|uniref:O-linked N-acetylglucosamine transferase family protein n=1 Tax=Azospirillum sp. TaxID=34012 RepID=UPI002D2B6FC1